MAVRLASDAVEFGDAVVEIADPGGAGDDLQAQFGDLLTAFVELALGLVQLGGAGGDVAVALFDVGAGGGERRLVVGDGGGQAGNPLLQSGDGRGQFVADAGELGDLLLAAGQVGGLGDQLVVELALGDFQPPGRDGEIGAKPVPVGVDLGTADGDARLDAGAGQAHGTPPHHGRHQQHQQPGG